MEILNIPVGDGSLRAFRFGHGPRVVVAAHGIAASGMAFRTVARHLPDGWSLVALDLRGRGASRRLPGPFGMSRHAEDIMAVVRSIGTAVVLTGQSMGAYAALRAAATRPDLVEKLVLVDGGLPLPVPLNFVFEEFLKLTARWVTTPAEPSAPSPRAYSEFFTSHPELAAVWYRDLAEYFRYDAAGDAATRYRASIDAIHADGRDLLLNATSFGDDLLKLRVPVTLLYAPRGLLGQEPGLLPPPVVDHWQRRVPHLRTELVAGADHNSILIADGPVRLITQRLTAPW